MKLPKFVHGYLDRHGKARFYLRRRGFKKVPLPGLPWSPEFMRAYESVLAGQPPIEPGKARLRPGTMDALALSYFASPAFTALADNSRLTYRRAIERFCREHGSKPAADMQRQHVVKLMAALSDRPQAANQLRKILRIMMHHAIEIGMRADDPTRDVKAIRVKSVAFTVGRKPKSSGSRRGGQSAPENDWHLHCCYSRVSGAAMCAVWGHSTLKKGCCGCGNKRQERISCSQYTRACKRPSLQRHAAT
jgi:hypothetical protein